MPYSDAEKNESPADENSPADTPEAIIRKIVDLFLELLDERAEDNAAPQGPYPPAPIIVNVDSQKIADAIKKALPQQWRASPG